MRNRDASSRALIVVFLALIATGIYILVPKFRDDPDLAAANDAISERHFEEAESHLNNYLEKNPNDVNAKLLAAQTARRQGKFDDATKHLRALEKQKGLEGSLDLEYRLLAIMRGDLSGAEESWNFCREHPNDPATPLMLEAVIVGSLQVLAPAFTPHAMFPIGAAPPLLEKTQRSIAFWLETQTRPADQIAGWGWRARVRRLARDHAGSLADLKLVLERDPNNLEAGFYYALFIAQESPLEARTRLESLARRYPENPHILFALATGSRGLGQLEESARILNRLISLHPEVPTAYLELGWVLLDQQKPAEAEPLLRKVLAMNPKSPEVHLALSRCMRLQQKADEAKQFQDRYLELEAENAPRASPSPQSP